MAFTGLCAKVARFLLLQVAVSIAFFGLLSTGALAQSPDSPISFDIPAQPLGSALTALAVQANSQIFFEQAPVAGFTAPAVSGSMSTEQALRTLLANTPLKFARNDDGTYVISRKASVARARTASPKVAAAAPVEAAPPTPPQATNVGPRSARLTEGPWMIRLRAIYLDPHNKSDSFSVPSTPPNAVPANGIGTNDKWGPELDAEYFFSPHWSTELALNFPRVHDLNLQSSATSGKVGDFRLTPNFLMLKFGFLPESAFRPYVGAGLNVTSLYSVHANDLGLSKTTAGPAAQAGFDLRLSAHWSLNADAKWARSRPVVDFDGQSIGHMKLDPLLFGIGLGYRFGGSPPPAIAEPKVAPAVVPEPPPLDSDGDGVPDSIDQCPNTPAGVMVDAVGCPLDSDKDGVPDYLDKCPGTPPGLKVDANGCEIEELVLTGVNFETASARLTPESSEILDKVVATLRLRPQASAEIHGYTDSRGSDAYNQRLSEQRAGAVLHYFVEQGIPSAHLSAKGFGKADPVASNATIEGRLQNRRVTVQFSRPVPR
jgi:outer membrane protein OmpA-like peptidoglycan-associated protein/outer membrane protein W